MQLTRLLFGIKALSVIGIVLAVYLLWQQFFTPSFQPCSINATINCDAIISGAVAKTLGIPTPLYGLVGYIVIFFAAMYRKKNLLLGTAIFGTVFCLWIGYREIFELSVLCPVCILCQVVILTIFILAIIVKKN